jgi:hypothetical protein
MTLKNFISAASSLILIALSSTAMSTPTFYARLSGGWQNIQSTAIDATLGTAIFPVVNTGISEAKLNDNIFSDTVAMGVNFSIWQGIAVEIAYQNSPSFTENFSDFENPPPFPTTSFASILRSKINLSGLFLNTYVTLWQTDNTSLAWVGGIGSSFISTKASLLDEVNGITYSYNDQTRMRNFAWRTGVNFDYHITPKVSIEEQFSYDNYGSAYLGDFGAGDYYTGTEYQIKNLYSNNVEIGMKYWF